MTLVARELFDQVLTDDTTSSSTSGSRAPYRPVYRSARDQTHHRGDDERRFLGTLVHLWGAYLGTAHEEDSILRRLEEVSTDVTSWELHEESTSGLAGVVAVSHPRREMFQMTINISPGTLPRRSPRFAFLDTRELQDDE